MKFGSEGGGKNLRKVSVADSGCPRSGILGKNCRFLFRSLARDSMVGRLSDGGPKWGLVKRDAVPEK